MDKLDDITKLVLDQMEKIESAGLFNGKTGPCIYFFLLFRKTGNTDHLKIAENLIEEIYNEVSKGSISPYLDNGLAGIALGFTFLERNGFVEADLNDVLSDLDDKIFKFLTGPKDNLSIGISQGVLGFLIYLILRLESKTLNPHNHYIFEMLVIDLLNHLNQLIEENKVKLQEPLLFDITWDLPMILITLSKIKSLNICSSKVDRIIEYLSPTVLSLLPYLDSNKLYFLLGIESILTITDLTSWRRHAQLISANINFTNIIVNEIKSLKIFINDGVSGLALISKELFEVTNDTKFLFPFHLIQNKIVESDGFKELEIYEYVKENASLINGLSGVGLSMLILEQCNSEILIKL
tara:strand:- start:9063 stop:10118 length:1056 start_codon:yes stop_codon:yes gene_type:complete